MDVEPGLPSDHLRLGIQPGERTQRRVPAALVIQPHPPNVPVVGAGAEHLRQGQLLQGAAPLVRQLLIWAFVVIIAWNRVAVTTPMLPGEYKPG